MEPTLENLALVLRDRGMWPTGFSWNYYNPHSCAAGMASKIWGCGFQENELDTLFGLEPGSARKLFFQHIARRRAVGDQSYADPTPLDIAADIDLFLKGELPNVY